jgi:hypothetical protein
LCTLVADEFQLTRDRSVFYCPDFAIRFSAASTLNFSNTVLSLSKLQKYDDRPFVVCVVTPVANHLLLANSTMLKKISHSSQQLREDNIRGSFNGSDISRDLDGISNISDNLPQLFDIHAELGFEGNLARLVEATNNISPSGSKFNVTPSNEEIILRSPERAQAFLASPDVDQLKSELDAKVTKYKNEILLAALIENVNVRGRVIEYLIAGEDEQLRQALIGALRNNNAKGLPPFQTENRLGDYTRAFEDFDTETDVKTKIMVLSSNPKAYNIDKILEFLAVDRSVFMFYFVGVDPGRIVNTILVSMFQQRLLAATVTLKHWAGRNSRGVTQFDGKVVSELIETPEFEIDVAKSVAYLKRLIWL